MYSSYNFLFACQLQLSSGNLIGTQAAGAYTYSGMSTVNYSLDLSDIRFPGSAGFAVGVGYVVSEDDALSAYFTLSQLRHLLG